MNTPYKINLLPLADLEQEFILQVIIPRNWATDPLGITNRLKRDLAKQLLITADMLKRWAEAVKPENAITIPKGTFPKTSIRDHGKEAFDVSFDFSRFQ